MNKTMETTDHKQPCACGDCRDHRREAALTAAKEQLEARRSAAACSAWRDAPPDSPGPWLEWTGYAVRLREVESRVGTSEVWIFWNNFYRTCSEIKTESKWAKISPPNALL